jgi:hypothetical protein
MKVRYGTDIENFAKAIGELLSSTDDPTLDALIALATAYHSIERLEDLGVDTTFMGKSRIKNLLEKAYREVMNIRKDVAAPWIDTSIITKGGRLIDGEG